ncbi:melanoma inhibitory activity protein 2 isoform X2 [Megalobrama amblycephala]|uniref:melanoma inhibitory activity protein 2 isoform X2 n=1 Tax=Megalobrama amblycephala TaxID=75352 RepID=UPI002013F5C0|nr:melanoma inhibitory activity protein 2 isoform X2 [Megalobrama amblycephala]
MNPNMAAVHSFILFHIVFGFLHHSLGLISDYKLCGDPECESMLSRVEAQRDHSAEDCRFLNFRKGEMITVYYKLTGKRNDLWAGSIEKLSGLFPKDAIKVEQLFIDEKKEIQVPTQEYDFICFDENGLVIEHSTEFDDLEDLTQETQETNINEVHDKPTEREEDEPSKISVQDVSDQNSPKTTEKGGSSWIGSAVSGWFGRNEQSNDEPQDESSEESFKSRKIVMDIEENHVEEKTNSGTFGWIRGELTNAFGFGNEDLKTQDNVENPTIDKDTSSQQSSSWISMGGDVLDVSEDNTPAATKPEAEMADENTNMEDQSILNPSENMDVDDKIQGDENKPDDNVENEDGPMENMRSDKEKVEEQTGWYGNMYNRITNLYKEEQTKQDEDDEGKESLSEEESPGFVTNTENIETKESETQSIFSVSGLTSVLKLPFQGDTVVKRDEEKTAKEEDPGKEDFEEQNNNEDQEARMLTDIDEQDSIPIDNDVLSETQSLSDKTKDSIAFDSTEESSMTEDSTDKSADNSNEEVKSANNADVLEGEVKQDMRDVQSDEEKSTKEVDSGKEDFLEQQKLKKEEMSDGDEQESTPTDVDLISETQALSDETMTLKDSDDIIKIDVFSQESNTQNDDDDDDKSANNTADDVIQRKNNLTDSSDDTSEDRLTQSLSDQDNVDTIKQQESDYDKISTDAVTGADTSELAETDIYNELHDQKTQESNVSELSRFVTISQSVNADVNKELNVDALSEYINENKLAEDDQGTSKEDDELIMERNNELVMDRNNELGTDKNDKLVKDRNDELVMDKNDKLDKDRNDELVMDKNDKLVKDRNDDLDKDRNDDLDKDRNDELVMDKNDKLDKDRNDELVMDKNDKLDKDRNDELVMDKNDKLVKDRNDDLDKDRNDELVMDKNDKLDKDRNDDLVKDRNDGLDKDRNDDLVKERNDGLVMDRYEAQLDEALSKDMFHEEKLSDSEALEMSSEHKLDTKISPLDEGTSHIPTLGTDELAVISEENIHSDLESNSALNATDDEMDNTSISHDVLLEIQTAGTSIVKDTDSEGKNADEVVVNGERKDLGRVSEPTENYFETKELKGDTQITNETPIEETQTKSPSLNTSNGSPDSEDDVHDLSLPENADYTSSEVTKLTDDFFLENVPVQDGNINNMVDQNQSVEHKEVTDTANKEDQTDLESVTKREESDTGATWDQKEDSDMAVQSEDKEKQGDEEQPGSPEIQDKKTFNHSTETSKEYTNLYPHLSEQNIQDLLHLFGDHKLSWLDSKIGNTDAGQDNEGLDELSDFEQLLEYHMKMNTKLGHIQQDNGFPGQNNIKEYPALQKLFTLLSTLREKYSPVITEVSVESPGISEDDCVHEACLDVNKNTLISSTELKNNQVTEDRSDINDTNNPQIEPVTEEKHLSANGDNVEDVQIDEQEIRKHEDWISSEIKKATSQIHSLISEEQVESQNGEGQFYQMAVFVEVTLNEIASIVDKVVSSLPDDIRPGPDLYGLPWEAVVFTGFLGLFTLLLFSCRFIHSVKSRLYASKEKQMAHKVAELLDEKCKVLETFSEVKQRFDKLESALQNNGVSAQASEKDSLEVASQKLEQSNAQMKKEIKRLQEELSQQNKARKQQEDQLAELEQILSNLEEEAKERKSQLEQDNTTLKIHEINTERLQKNLQAAKEEHAMLLESKAQLVQEAEGWGERLGELEEEMKMCERSHSGMLEDCTNKDERIKSLTECLLKMRDWDSEDESSVDGSTNTENEFHKKQKVQKLIEAAKMSADLKSMEEDKNRVFAKLADEIKAKEDLQEGIKQLEEQKEVLESESANYSSESQKLQQKLQIMTEMYQENELKLHRMLTVEEKERSQKEEKLNKAGKKISLTAEELITYRQRAKDLEEELDRTSQAYKNQITSHEKKAHDNWLAARAADRDLADVKRENAHLRQKLTDAQFKVDILEKDVREGRPLFRGERSPYGPSPLGRPSSETRTFLSPPTLMDGPPRLSPQFMGPGRASRGLVEPPSGGPDFERSGPHSDSGSLSPSWDRERRGPPAPPGHPLPDPGLPYRRPPPGPYSMGPLPHRPPLPPEPYFDDKSDPSFLRNSSSISENESRDGPHSMTGDMRLPPDPDSRMGPPPGPPLMGIPPPMDPRDPRFLHRGPYGPPEFFPPRGPGVPPIGMRGPLPPGMFPRAPMPLPQHMGYLPPRPPPDSFPPGPPPRPSPPGSEQPPNQSPSPHDVI